MRPTMRPTMRPLEFVAHGDKDSYTVYDKNTNSPLYTVKRESAGKWVARDMEGNQVDEPDQYRHDLFDRLKMQPEA